MTLDVQQHTLNIADKNIELTNLEFRLLHTFVKNVHQALDRDFLRDEVWGNDSVTFHDKTINVVMNRLKKKIDPEGGQRVFRACMGCGL